jgi:hypothetical protein
MNVMTWLAILLLILWLVLKLALAITSGLLHLIWIAALVMLAASLLGKLRGTREP